MAVGPGGRPRERQRVCAIEDATVTWEDAGRPNGSDTRFYIDGVLKPYSHIGDQEINTAGGGQSSPLGSAPGTSLVL